jgi:hypothetical protein
LRWNYRKDTTTTDAHYYHSSSEHKATKNPFLQLFHQYSNEEIPTSKIDSGTTTVTIHPPSDQKVSFNEGTTNANGSTRVTSIFSVADFVKWNIGKRRQRMDSSREVQRIMSIEQGMESLQLGSTASNNNNNNLDHTNNNVEWEPQQRPTFRRASLGKERNDITTTKIDETSLGAIDETTNDF